MMGTMRAYVLCELVLVSSRWDDAMVYPVLGGFEGYVEFEGKMAYCEPIHGEPGFQIHHIRQFTTVLRSAFLNRLTYP